MAGIVRRWLWWSMSLVLVLLPRVATSVAAAASPPPAAQSVHLPPLQDFSPGLLGLYRKVMAVETDIERYAAKYGVDVSLAKAVCMYESGGNAQLASSAGAQGYFQVMPATFRMMGVPTNIEAGIKYLGMLVKQFGREDYALAAYNGGPGRVVRGRPPLESLQYVLGVGTYRTALQNYEPAIRAYARQLRSTLVGEHDDWWTLSTRLHLPVVQLRLHNPFLASRSLRVGQMIVFPAEPRGDLFDVEERARYRTRIGDNYLKVAYALGIDAELMRHENRLWRLQFTPPFTALTIPLDPNVTFTSYTADTDETIPRLAARLQTTPWWIVRDNYLWDDRIRAGTTLRIRVAAPPPRARVTPPPVVAVTRWHTVRRRETLSAIARQHATSVRALQAANGLGRRTRVTVGQRLRLPAR